MPFACSICGEESTQICARCTKDACDNHICEKCLRCSDCCECEVRLAEPLRMMVHPPTAAPTGDAEPAAPAGSVIPEPEPEPGTHLPQPDPDPEPPAPNPFPEPQPDPDPDVLPDTPLPATM